MKIYIPLIVLVALCATPALAHEEQHPTPEPSVEQAAPGTPEATVDAFHHAIAAGDGDTALGYLAEDIVIFEEGGAEMSRAEYESHHLGSDMSFSAAVKRTLVDRRSGVAEGTAWVLTRTTTQGTFRDFEIDSVGAETMLLRQSADGWRIVHIHWSSHSK